MHPLVPWLQPPLFLKFLSFLIVLPLRAPAAEETCLAAVLEGSSHILRSSSSSAGSEGRVRRKARLQSSALPGQQRLPRCPAVRRETRWGACPPGCPLAHTLPLLPCRYGGHCPRYKFTMGQTYGKLTGQLLSSPEVAPPGRGLLQPNRRLPGRKELDATPTPRAPGRSQDTQDSSPSPGPLWPGTTARSSGKPGRSLPVSWRGRLAGGTPGKWLEGLVPPPRKTPSLGLNSPLCIRRPPSPEMLPPLCLAGPSSPRHPPTPWKRETHGSTSFQASRALCLVPGT
ncbi:hypothetical protein JRQ81_013050 [Phrynocephalus forsythii]|uniref:Ciliary microtubule inner protein 2B n=1 Tax=Phrynocephalus forsythii TaxID=171643 RepID=A0A9Q0Y127_9SAUR|nr:hypothetical protein JRQ81_013050 [Phrynocephalus forsythii]